MQTHVEVLTRRWVLLRSFGVFLLTVFGILALGTEVVDVANGYFNLSLTPQMGLGIVIIILTWAFLLTSTAINVEGSSRDRKFILMNLFVGVFLTFLVSIFLIGGYFISDPPIEPRIVANAFAATAVLGEALVAARRYYLGAKFEAG